MYEIKLIDELGECYFEREIPDIRKVYTARKEWGYIHHKTCVFNIGDVTICKKDNGEEFWYYVKS